MMQRVGLAALGALVVVCAVWYGIFWRSETNHLKASKAQFAQVSQQVSIEEAAHVSLLAEAEQAKDDRPVLNKLVALLPYGPSLDEAYATITAAAEKAGTELQSVATPEPTDWTGSEAAAGSTGAPLPAASGAQALTISVDLTGAPSEVMNFISDVDRSPRLYVVTQFAINTTGAATDLSIVAFYQNATATDPVFPGQQSSGTTAPASSAEATSATTTTVASNS